MKLSLPVLAAVLLGVAPGGAARAQRPADSEEREEREAPPRRDEKERSRQQQCMLDCQADMIEEQERCRQDDEQCVDKAARELLSCMRRCGVELGEP